MKILLIFSIITISACLSAKDDVIQCGNLIFAGDNTSRCFSDEFLSAMQRRTSIPTARRFRSVKLDSEELFKFPFVIMTGESEFYFSRKERENLEKYLSNGGFMLVSAGCSNKNFTQAFRRELARVFYKDALKSIPGDHKIFRTVNNIEKIEPSKQDSSLKAELFGMEINGKLVLVFSPHGLNDTANTKGCCCCGGNELENSIDINMNILAYALTH